MPSIVTARLEAAPKTRRTGGIVKRSSLAPVGDDRVGAGVEGGAGVRVAGGGDAAAGADHVLLEAGPQLQAAAVAADLPDAGAVDAVEAADQLGGGVHQPLRVAVGERPFAELGDDFLLVDRVLQVDLGALALGDVEEHAVPDRDALLVGFEHRLVEHPDDLAVAAEHPVLDRHRLAAADQRLVFDRQRPLAVVGVQQPRPEARVGEELLGAVAEDLLDLGADVAPAALLAELGGVDDHRQPLDHPAVVLTSPAGDLIEEPADLVVGPVALAALAHRGGIDRSGAVLEPRAARHALLHLSSPSCLADAT